MKRKAVEQAKIAEDKLEERLAQGGFYHALAEFLVDVPPFPLCRDERPHGTHKNTGEVDARRSAVSGAESVPQPAGGDQTPTTPGMPSLTPQSNQVAPAPGMAPSPQMGMPNGMPGAPSSPMGAPPKPPQRAQVATPQVVDIPMLCWERISPFDIYWTPGVANVADANIIERSRLTRADINDLLDLPGFNTDEVRAVLDEYGRGGLVDNWDVTDAERAILEGREDPRFNQSGLIACLEFQGMAQGRFLLDLGVDPATIPDPMRDYFCNAWLIGRHIIKVQYSPSPRKRHNYYVTSFEKVPGNPCGNGLPDLLADISSVANATLRALVNNLSIASGPQVVVNDDRLGDGEDGEQMYPWKRWHTKADPFGNNTEKAIEFFNTASNSQELLQVYLAFSNMADETSAIPKFMTGTPPQGGLGRTASGLSMLMQNSSKILQTVASNIDRDVIEPILNSLFDMVMLTDDTGLLTGEEKIRVLGVAVAQQRETQRARQLEFLQITGNPIDMSIIGPKGRAKILRNVATEIGMPGEDIVPTDDEMDAKEKQQQQMQQAMAAQGQPGGGTILSFPRWSARSAARGTAGRRSTRRSPTTTSSSPRGTTARCSRWRAANPGIKRRRPEDEPREPRRANVSEFVNSESDERTKNNAVRHQYRVLTDEEKKAMVAVKDAGLLLLQTLDRYCHPGRELSLAKTKAEEAVMWAVKGITQ